MYVTTIRLNEPTQKRLRELANAATDGNASEVIRRLLAQAVIKHVVRADVVLLDEGAAEMRDGRA